MLCEGLICSWVKISYLGLQLASIALNQEPVGRRVREIAGQMEATIRHLNATMPDLLLGYRVKIIDGNAICASQQRFAIAATEHRLKVLRDKSSTPLPGQSLTELAQILN